MPDPSYPDLSGKVVIVTGASRGIGADIARAFALADAHVLLVSRDSDALGAVVRDIADRGGSARASVADVGDPEAVHRMVAAALDAHGRLDCAVNNAGAFHLPTPLADVRVEDFDHILRTHARGVFLCMKEEIAAMRATGGGAIVNMTSTAGLQGVRGMSAYSAAKHAIVGLTQCAALDYAAQGIRVNAVAPGPIVTERIARLDADALRPIERAVPMGRIGAPAEVASVVLWLCSSQASFVTGATIPIDGGRMAGS